VGLILVGETGNFYLLPASISAGLGIDFLIFGKFISFKKLRGNKMSNESQTNQNTCCGIFNLISNKFLKRLKLSG